ncbi:hypothetical protein HZA56_05800 [Candidatus Poribacteria bacterium]|nr:hypothetical protein [Candidatus Poribacteria bacterium]
MVWRYSIENICFAGGTVLTRESAL